MHPPPSTLTLETPKRESLELKEDPTFKEGGNKTYENTRIMGKPAPHICTYMTEYCIFLVQDRAKDISVEEFSGHVQRMHADRDKWFEMEYNVSSTHTHK